MKQQPVKQQWSRVKYVLGLCVLLLILFRIDYFIQFVLNKILKIPYDSLFFDITDIILHMAVFITVIGVGLKKQKKTLTSVCYFKKVNGAVWVAAILCSIGYTLFNFYLGFLFVSFKYGWDTGFGQPESDFLYNLIDTAIIPAVAEELLYKGVIFTILKKHFSVVLAVIITSIMFSACHLSFIGFIPHFLFACFTFWLYLKSGSIVLPMILHFINNLFTFVLISEPFESLGTFYASLVILGVGSYMLYKTAKIDNSEQVTDNKEENI